MKASRAGMLNGVAGVVIAEVSLNALGVQNNRGLWSVVAAIAASGVLMGTVMKGSVKKMSKPEVDDFATYSFATPLAFYGTQLLGK